MARFGRLPNAWENFEAALGAFSAIVEEQREGLKSNVASEVKEVQGRLDKLASRWNALKPGKEMKGWSAAEVEAVFTSRESKQTWGLGFGPAVTSFCFAVADWKSQTDTVKAAVQAVLESCETFVSIPARRAKVKDPLCGEMSMLAGPEQANVRRPHRLRG